MLRYFVIIALLGIVSTRILRSNETKTMGRIVNGIATNIWNHPYQVSLQRQISGRHLCGGSIINQDIIVTAAHCLVNEKIENLQVRLGSTCYKKGGTVVKVEAFKIHEDYNDDTNKNDIAVLKLAKPVMQSRNVRYIQMAERPPLTGTPAVITGWGTTCYLYCPYSNNLMKVEVSFLSQKECASKNYMYDDRILDGMVCTYTKDKDSCNGDSGGPLVAGGKLVGVVSWGQGCAKKGYPAVYSDIAYFHNWILQAIKQINK